MKSAIKQLFIKINEDMKMSAEHKKVMGEFLTAHKEFLNSLGGKLGGKGGGSVRFERRA